MILLLFAQIDWQKFKPENIFGGRSWSGLPLACRSFTLYRNRDRFRLSVLITFIDNFRRPNFIFESNLPREVSKKLTLYHRQSQYPRLAGGICSVGIFGFRIFRVHLDILPKNPMRSFRLLRIRICGHVGRSARPAFAVGCSIELANSVPPSLITSWTIKEISHMLFVYGEDGTLPALWSAASSERTIYKRHRDPMPEAWEVLRRRRSRKTSRQTLKYR